MEEEIQIVKKEKTERERQTFFRVTFKNNCNLLQIADNKANIIISINALVISSTIAILGYSSLSSQIDTSQASTLLPILLLLGICLCSTILAVQAAKPKIMGKGTKVQLKPKSSVLFFGFSSNFTMDEYLKEVNKILLSKGDIHEHMSVSLYYQAKVLDRKYRLLRHAYNVFMLGLIVGVLSFALYMMR